MLGKPGRTALFPNQYNRDASPMNIKQVGTAALSIALVAGFARGAAAQIPTTRFGEAVPRDVREMYDRGLQYLAKTQSENGDWPGGGGENGPGTTGMAMMVFLACGEDPNFGQYSNHIRKAVRNMIKGQDAGTGIMGPSMYHHGFATLALAEAYGVVDERSLWPDGKAPRSIGQARSELAVHGQLSHRRRRTPWRVALIHPTRAMPIPLSAGQSSWGCWPLATPESKFPMNRSTKRSRSLRPDDFRIG